MYMAFFLHISNLLYSGRVAVDDTICLNERLQCATFSIRCTSFPSSYLAETFNLSSFLLFLFTHSLAPCDPLPPSPPTDGTATRVSRRGHGQWRLSAAGRRLHRGGRRQGAAGPCWDS